MKYYEELNMHEAMSISGGSASDIIWGIIKKVLKDLSKPRRFDPII